MLEVFRAEEVTAAVRSALSLGAISFDAVKHLVLCRIAKRPPRLDLSAYPYLARRHGEDDESRRLRHPDQRGNEVTASPEVLLAHQLKQLQRPTFLREYAKLGPPVRGRRRRPSALPAHRGQGRAPAAQAAGP